jgi:hypothetical protein
VAIEASRMRAVGVARVSISLLQLLTQALLAAAVAERLGGEDYGNGHCFVLRCDNQSACQVEASRRPSALVERGGRGPRFVPPLLTHLPFQIHE